MLIALSILGLIVLGLAVKAFRLNTERLFLDQAACVERARAQIATELLYEGHTKHKDLSFEDTMNIIEGIRNEPSMIGRRALADKIVLGPRAEQKKVGF